MYKWSSDNESYIRLSDGAFIPQDIFNTDYKEVYQFVKDGGILEAADPIPEYKAEPTLSDVVSALKTKNIITDQDLKGIKKGG